MMLEEDSPGVPAISLPSPYAILTGTATYWTDSMSLFFIEIIAMNFAELKRLQDYR
jgi:hypothetical protein